MSLKIRVIDNAGQMRAWQELQEEIKNAPEQVPCISYPDAFFIEHNGYNTASRWAVLACSTCPIKNACASYAMQYEAEGIWGGLTPRDRERLRRAKGLSLEPLRAS